ncbi:MAG: class I SAM-dependent RNA methyltransferase [Opitutae bacterium]|nr:class I SAM-dependent RNA methyltransferase [Opitutae bacterium]
MKFEQRPPRAPRKFKPVPYAYHEEIELEVSTLTNRGEGLGRVNGWVVMVPFALPGERIVARIWFNEKNFSRGDLVRVLTPSPARVEPVCPLFKTCGGCQYQNLSYESQLAWKTQQVRELLERLAKIDVAVNPCHGSPKEYGYRTKITPHFEKPHAGESDFPIGFLRHNSRSVIDVANCPIATDAINAEFPKIREKIREKAAAGEYDCGATILMRETLEGVTTDANAQVSERVGDLTLRFLAGDFFQNNPFVLPEFVGFGVRAASSGGCKYLVDAYCGSGLFALSAAKLFARVLGVEVSTFAVEKARENARCNNLGNCEFVAGSSETIFAQVAFPPSETAIIIDPPRKGCTPEFISQMMEFSPRRIVYVSCAPDTQARDLKIILDSGKYELEEVQPFDLFPQTRHIENIAVLNHK